MKKIYILVGAIVLLGLSWFGYFIFTRNPESISSDISTNEANTQANSTQSSIMAPISSTEDKLIFLIEEEKLAHDIYSKLFDIYGAKVFGNILESEETHQNRVLALLEARNINDPRKEGIGIFTNQDLQSLYDQLLAKAKLSEHDAYEVGVTIEEKDIADITDILSVVPDEDIVTALEALRSGSENHLRAFNRQLAK